MGCCPGGLFGPLELSGDSPPTSPHTAVFWLAIVWGEVMDDLYKYLIIPFHTLVLSVLES